MKSINSEEERDAANHPFSMEGIYFRSFTSFLCGIKFPEDYERRQRAFALNEERALKIVDEAEEVVMHRGRYCLFGSFVFWKGKVIDTRSIDYHDLLTEARNIIYGREI